MHATRTGISADNSRVDDTGRAHLRRCVDLARESLEAGDEPFGSLLVDATGLVRFEDRNRVRDGDATRHPELAIVHWAIENLSPAERRAAVVYTSGEHCPMCSAAHAWAGLGTIVMATSSEQLASWHDAWGLPAGPVAALPVKTVAPDVPVIGPDPAFASEVRDLHARLAGVEE